MKLIIDTSYPGFYRIDGYKNYSITKCGTLINRNTSEIIKGSINQAGYCHFRIVKDSGSCFTIGRHRLLCMVFKSRPVNHENLYVNHKDGIKGRDVLPNLEWATAKENCEHAGDLGITPKCIPLELRNIKTGHILSFPSFTEGARFLNITRDAVSHRVKSNGSVSYGNFCYRKRSKEEWPLPGKRGMYVRCLFTGEVTYYSKLSEAARAVGCNVTSFPRWFRNSKQKVTSTFKQVKMAITLEPWEEILDPYLAYEKCTGLKVVVMTNKKTGVVRVFPKMTACAKFLGLNKTTLAWRLKFKGDKIFDNMSVCYYTDYKFSVVNKSL